MLIRCLMRSTSAGLGDGDLVDAVELVEVDVDPLGAGGRQVLADVVGAERQLAVAAVGQDGELHARRPAVVEQRLDRRAHGAPGEEHVVDDDHGRPGHVEVQVRGVDGRRVGGPAAQVVAVEADVEVAQRDVGLEQVGEQVAQPRGEQRAPAVDAHDRQRRRGIGVLLDDLVRDADERAAHVVPVEDDLLLGHGLLPGLSGPG